MQDTEPVKFHELLVCSSRPIDFCISLETLEVLVMIGFIVCLALAAYFWSARPDPKTLAGLKIGERVVIFSNRGAIWDRGIVKGTKNNRIAIKCGRKIRYFARRRVMQETIELISYRALRY